MNSYFLHDLPLNWDARTAEPLAKLTATKYLTVKPAYSEAIF